jgi:hypothetical protein
MDNSGDGRADAQEPATNTTESSAPSPDDL